MVATTVQKSIGLVRAGVEHVWRRGWSLYGSRRFPSDAGWMDVLEANRRLERHQIHARLGWQGKRHSFISHYEYISSHDDTDGSLSFAARYDDLRAEWARSTGIAKHHASAVLDLILPRSASVSLSGGWHDSVPMNIVTGEDREGSLLFLTRPSARRNSGLGPGFRSVDGHGRYPLAFRVFNRRVAFDVNVLATDLLGKRNYTALNGVQSSPFYRQPLGAFPGPALKIWISVRQ